MEDGLSLQCRPSRPAGSAALVSVLKKNRAHQNGRASLLACYKTGAAGCLGARCLLHSAHCVLPPIPRPGGPKEFSPLWGLESWLAQTLISGVCVSRREFLPFKAGLLQNPLASRDCRHSDARVCSTPETRGAIGKHCIGKLPAVVGFPVISPSFSAQNAVP
jgi:hypothetical protein